MSDTDNNALVKPHGLIQMLYEVPSLREAVYDDCMKELQSRVNKLEIELAKYKDYNHQYAREVAGLQDIISDYEGYSSVDGLDDDSLSDMGSREDNYQEPLTHRSVWPPEDERVETLEYTDELYQGVPYDRMNYCGMPGCWENEQRICCGCNVRLCDAHVYSCQPVCTLCNERHNKFHDLYEFMCSRCINSDTQYVQNVDCLVCHAQFNPKNTKMFNVYCDNADIKTDSYRCENPWIHGNVCGSHDLEKIKIAIKSRQHCFECRLTGWL